MNRSLQDMSEEGLIQVVNEKDDELNDLEQSGAAKGVPDGGWGWCVVAACFLCNVVNGGIVYSFGIILEPMRSDLNVSFGSISLVGGVLAGVTVLVGPIAAVFVNRFGSRITCIVGSIISSAAIFASSYSNSFIFLLITYGLLAGLGLGFIYFPAVVAVGEYFRKRLSLATGICVCGSGAGTFLVALFESSLLGHFGWRGCNRIMALLCLCCALFGLVFIPQKKKREEVNENNNNNLEEINEKSGLKILRDIPFFLMTLANIPNAMGIYISYTYLPSMAGETGLSASDASFLISMVGISNTLGRFLSGWLADLKWASALGITIITAAAASVLCALLPSGHYWSLLAMSAVFGFIVSSGSTVSTPLIVDLLGIHHLNTAFGILTFVRGVAALLGPTAAGFILDGVASSFSLPFYIASVCFAVSAILHTFIWIFKRRVYTRRYGYTDL
eukprot:GFUD01021165.1.p1 GENE.GFUD01021165.1~~GFUD01021165.1.p1  ORF type:complete len:446 (-),score=66.10 GFUD01021165.1:65-1402(-)